MTVTNKSPEKGTLTGATEAYEFQYNPLKRGQDTKITLAVTSAETLKMKSVGSGCQCTTPEIKNIGGQDFLEITYNSQILGRFTKKATLQVTEGSLNKVLVITIKGEVTP